MLQKILELFSQLPDSEDESMAHEQSEAQAMPGLEIEIGKEPDEDEQLKKGM